MKNFVIFAMLIVKEPRLGLVSMLKKCPETVMPLFAQKAIVGAFLAEHAMKNYRNVPLAIKRLTASENSTIQKAGKTLSDCFQLLGS